MPESDTALLVTALREAGGIARRYFGGHYKTFRKERGDPVTEADLEIDAFLKQRLLGARPGYGWLSEESEDDLARLLASSTFVVDPIDGTHGFVKGRPQFTIVAAVVTAQRPVAAAIYNPITEEMYEATAGQGARKNGAPIRVSTRNTFEGMRLLATRNFLDVPHWTGSWPLTVTVETRASIAYRMALVAEGGFDAMVSLSNKSDWDLAAGDLLVHEAGGQVTAEDGALLRYNCEACEQAGVVCAGSELHGRLIEKLREHIPSR